MKWVKECFENKVRWQTDEVLVDFDLYQTRCQCSWREPSYFGYKRSILHRWDGPACFVANPEAFGVLSKFDDPYEIDSWLYNNPADLAWYVHSEFIMGKEQALLACSFPVDTESIITKMNSRNFVVMIEVLRRFELLSEPVLCALELAGPM